MQIAVKSSYVWSSGRRETLEPGRGRYQSSRTDTFSPIDSPIIDTQSSVHDRLIVDRRKQLTAEFSHTPCRNLENSLDRESLMVWLDINFSWDEASIERERVPTVRVCLHTCTRTLRKNTWYKVWNAKYANRRTLAILANQPENCCFVPIGAERIFSKNRFTRVKSAYVEVEWASTSL